MDEPTQDVPSSMRELPLIRAARQEATAIALEPDDRLPPT